MAKGDHPAVAWDWMKPALLDLSRQLTDRDLEFVIRATSSRRTDYDRIREIVRDKPDFLEVLLEDDRVFQKMASDDDVMLKVSPQLLFAVLLRRARRLLKQASFTMEPRPEGDVPVFDASKAAQLVEQPRVLDYLASMLASFVRTESRTFFVRHGAVYRRRVFNDMNVDDLLSAAELLDPPQRFPIYKRVADVSLFMVGIFPDHVSGRRSAARPWWSAVARSQRFARDQQAYAEIGTEFYHRAAEDEAARQSGLADVMVTLGDHFMLAAKPLNLLARDLIPMRRFAWFGAGPASPESP